jgi:hypothetical protein
MIDRFDLSDRGIAQKMNGGSASPAEPPLLPAGMKEGRPIRWREPPSTAGQLTGTRSAIHSSYAAVTPAAKEA